MKKILSLSVVVLTIILFTALSSTNAAVFLSNAPFDLNGGPCIGGNGALKAAVGFTTSSSDTMLGYVSVLWHEVGGPIPMTLSLYDDNAGQPGNSLATIGTKMTVGGGSVYTTYTYSTNIKLEASTTYWIVGNTTSTDFCSVGWGRDSATPTGTFTFVGGKQLSGGIWNDKGTLSIELGEGSPVTYAPGEDVQFTPNDDRINHTTSDRAAPVAIFCEPHGIQVRLIDPATGVGIDPPAINMFTEDIEAAGIPTEENLLLAENEGVSLYRLTTGEFQVNVLDANSLEYKWFVFVWDQCPVPTNSYHLELKG